jgi:Spy/CpxP family protein refolding chaperone
MKTSIVWGLLGLILFGSLALAGGHQHQKGNSPAPGHEGQQSRQYASFSAEDAAGLIAGRGLGLARPAELNGYPGPMHVLEHGDALALSADQRAIVMVSFDAMRERAKDAGRRYLQAERALDGAFKSGSADLETVTRLTREADARRAEVRLSHMQAHLEMHAVLSAEQRIKYANLRGYETAR